MTRKRLSVSKMTGSYMSVALQLVVKSDVGTPQDLKSLLNWTTLLQAFTPFSASLWGMILVTASFAAFVLWYCGLSRLTCSAVLLTCLF